MGVLELRHEVDQMVVEYLSVLDELDAFPNQHFGHKVANRLGLDMVAQQLDIVLTRLEEKAQKLI